MLKVCKLTVDMAIYLENPRKSYKILLKLLKELNVLSSGNKHLKKNEKTVSFTISFLEINK